MRGGRTLGSQLRLRPWRRAAWLELSLWSREKASDFDRFPRITLTFFSYVIGNNIISWGVIGAVLFLE